MTIAIPLEQIMQRDSIDFIRIVDDSQIRRISDSLHSFYLDDASNYDGHYFVRYESKDGKFMIATNTFEDRGPVIAAEIRDTLGLKLNWLIYYDEEKDKNGETSYIPSSGFVNVNGKVPRGDTLAITFGPAFDFDMSETKEKIWSRRLRAAGKDIPFGTDIDIKGQLERLAKVAMQKTKEAIKENKNGEWLK